LAAGEMTGPLRTLVSVTQAREEVKDAQVGIRFKASVDAELRGTLDETREELLGISHKDGDRNRHAPLTGSTKGGASDRVQRVIYVGCARR